MGLRTVCVRSPIFIARGAGLRLAVTLKIFQKKLFLCLNPQLRDDTLFSEVVKDISIDKSVFM